MDHPFHRILLATEHTEFDSGAERVALELARRCALPLMAVVPVASNPEYEAIAPELSAQVDRDTAAHIAELRAAAHVAGVALDVCVRRGEEAWREIVAEAGERKADLVVTRRRGRRSFLADLLVGDMVSKVAGHAPCSVLMAPRNGGMWSRGVLAAVDDSDLTERVAGVAAAVAERCALPLFLVGVIAEDIPALRSRAEVALARASAAAGTIRSDHTGILVGKPHEEIIRQAVVVGADLLVIGRRGETSLARPLLGATAQKVIGLADGPVLVVHP